MGGVNLVAGFRPELWREAVPDNAPKALEGFNEDLLGLDGFVMPATQHDAVLWLSGSAYDVVFDVARSAIAELRGLASVGDETSSWPYRHDLDLTGFIDGTENPTLIEAPEFVLIPEGDPGAGGTILLLQKWTHDASEWESLPVSEQERVIGRTKPDSVLYKQARDFGKLMAAKDYLVITGAGRGFSAGQDLTAFGEAGDVASMLRATYHVNVTAIRSLEKPVIAAVNGVCAGAGLSLACACDIRLASDAAFFVPGFVGIGLIPDSGGTYFIQRLLGTPRAFEWMTSNRRLTAAEAHVWGLVSEVVEADAFPARVAERAAELAAAPTRAIALTKRLYDEAGTSTLEEQLEREAEAQAEAAQTDDFREGVAAFGEKRAPEFRGR